MYPPVARPVAMVANWHSRNIDQPITKPSDGIDGPPSVSQRTAGKRHRHGEFRQRQDPGQIEQANDQRGDQHGDRTVVLQRQVPAEVFAGDHHADAERPDIEDAERAFERVLREKDFFLGTQRAKLNRKGSIMIHDRFRWAKRVAPENSVPRRVMPAAGARSTRRAEGANTGRNCWIDSEPAICGI